MTSRSIASSIPEIHAGPEAPLVAAVLEKLKDIDAQRIAKQDGFVIRKAVLALLELVGELEERIGRLEGELAASTSPSAEVP
ncbi:hypothetical protein [Rhodococcus ruber]|uniref:hypothetical protein n=1 Tax=Rhodococcus ruber TaxID=1830 RepID=UPI0012695218|nr:hypothetical protein [Rhodococcus ruber]